MKKATMQGANAVFKKACKKLKMDSTVLPDFSMLPEEFREPLLSHFKLIIITKAKNGGWEPNWNDAKEWKYYPWLRVNASVDKPSGFGLSYGDYVDTYSYTTVGSRLCFKSEALARETFEECKALYESYFLIIK